MTPIPDLPPSQNAAFAIDMTGQPTLLDAMPDPALFDAPSTPSPSKERPKVDGVAHPTVKPLDLMRWLVRLVTPPGGTVLEPFLGSGTTAEACRLEGFRCIGIERDETYLPLTMARLGVRRREDIPPWELDDAA